MKTILLAGSASILAIGLLATTANAATGITSVTSPTVWPNNDNQDHSLGWAFSTRGQTIAALGYNDFGFGSPHNVGLYDSSGALLASALVSGSSTLLNGYRYTDLGSALVLGAGTYYLVGTTTGVNDGWTYQAASFATNAATTYVNSYFTSGTGGVLAFPTSLAADRQYLLTNFSDVALTSSAVPEPATWAMMLVGIGLAGAMMRRRHNVRVSFV